MRNKCENTVLSIVGNFQKSTAIVKLLRLYPLVLLMMVALKQRWECSIGGIILTEHS
jgi:hypothetical protein